jgi:hypothetical protein
MNGPVIVSRALRDPHERSTVTRVRAERTRMAPARPDAAAAGAGAVWVGGGVVTGVAIAGAIGGAIGGGVVTGVVAIGGLVAGGVVGGTTGQSSTLDASAR